MVWFLISNEADFATAKSASLFSDVIPAPYWYFIIHYETVECYTTLFKNWS